MLQLGSNPDTIFDLKRRFAQSERLSMNFYGHMENLDLILDDKDSFGQLLRFSLMKQGHQMETA